MSAGWSRSDVDFTVDAFPTRTFHGKVVQVRNAPITVQNVVTYDTVIGVTNPDLKLKPGMTANVSIVVAHRDDVLKIRNAALRFRCPTRQRERLRPKAGSFASGRSPGANAASGERRVERTVYVLRRRRIEAASARSRPGSATALSTEVLEGLKEGDRVVTGVTEAADLRPRRQRIRLAAAPRRFLMRYERLGL